MLHGIDEEMFRYRNTNPPTTLEAAVLMICDSVDATIRSKEHASEHVDVDDINEIIMSTINRLGK
jgi:membrane-associated HD superfamily phosphohydrolase